VVRHAVRNERLAQDNNIDRMTAWIQNVESKMIISMKRTDTDPSWLLSEVVADARREFAAAPLASAPLPPLPVAPCRRNSQRRTQRMPRKILTAREIFTDSVETTSTAGDQTKSDYATANSSLAVSDRSLQATAAPERKSDILSSPHRTRRATVSGLTSEATRKSKGSLEPDAGSSFKRTFKSQGDLLAQPITPVRKLEMELEKCKYPAQ
jgi:hypothetical protein